MKKNYLKMRADANTESQLDEQTAIGHKLRNQLKKRYYEFKRNEEEERLPFDQKNFK